MSVVALSPEWPGIGRTPVASGSTLVPEMEQAEAAVAGRIINMELERCMIRLSALVDITQKKRSGVPVLKNTRFAIAQIIAEIADGRSVDQLCKNFDLIQEQVEEVLHAIAFCLDQPMGE